MELKQQNLIFIISLPRSGSTLLQRLLSSNPEIHCQGELWLLLNFFYIRRKSVFGSEYGVNQLTDVLNDLIAESNVGEEKYASAVRHLYLEIINGLIKSNKSYLVDKTPRYHLILDELVATFPEAKFIVLYRNPLSIFSSYLNAMRSNKLRRTDGFDLDLINGPRNIAQFYEKHKDHCSKVIYENLVRDPKKVLLKLYEELGIAPDLSCLSSLSNIKMKGKGDSLGRHKYAQIVNRNDGWKDYIDSPLRKKVATSYLHATDLAYMQQGEYNQHELTQVLAQFKPSKYRIEEYYYRLEQSFICFLKHLRNRISVS